MPKLKFYEELARPYPPSSFALILHRFDRCTSRFWSRYFMQEKRTRKRNANPARYFQERRVYIKRLNDFRRLTRTVTPTSDPSVYSVFLKWKEYITANATHNIVKMNPIFQGGELQYPVPAGYKPFC